MYSNIHTKKLISYVLSGDELAAKEFIKRHRERKLKLNPILGRGRTSLFQLIVRRDLTKIAIAFIKFRVEVNIQDSFGCTPLHEAAINGNEILVERLLEKGANPLTCNADGITAEIVAGRYGHKELALRLRSLLPSIYPNLNFSHRDLSQGSENQDEPLDLSKTAPHATSIKPSFFKLNKASPFVSAEKVLIEIDDSYVFGVERFTC